MARTFSGENRLGVMAQGLYQPVPKVRAWVRDVVRLLRTEVLPDPDDAPADPDARATVDTSPRARRMDAFLRVLIPVSMTALVLLVLGLVAVRVIFADRLYPTIVVGDVPVGGLTIDQAERRLSDRVTTFEQRPISFVYGERTWTPTLSELGATVMLDESIAQAQRLGREPASTDRLAFIGDMLRADQIVPVRTRFDQRVLDAWFDAVDRDIGHPPVDARIAIDGTSVTVSPETNGIGVDRNAATAHLTRAFSALDTIAVTLPTRVVLPDLTAQNLAEVQAQVADVVSKPLPVTLNDHRWEIDAATVSPFLDVAIATESGTPYAELSIDTDGLAAALRAQFAEQVNRTAANAVLGWDDGLAVLAPSTTGIMMRAGSFADAVATSVLDDHASVEIPVIVIEPEITGQNLDAYGIETLLGQGDSNFEGGSWEREENIRVGMRTINGTLVPPGGTFSFNQVVGAITYDKGYQDALVATAEMIGDDVGGGICQVSTTVFRAALFAGLPIVEWYAHTRRLPYYERDGWGPGFDASILQMGPNPDEWPDLKFENDTEHWLLIEASISDPHVYVNIYGSYDGRSVDVDSDASPIGDKAFGFNRVVQDAQGKVIEDRSFESYFQ